MTAFDVIDEVRLGSDAANVTFSSIPTTYKDLCIIASVRHAANWNGDLAVQINNVNTNSYPWGVFKFNGSSTGTGLGGNGTIYTPIGILGRDNASTGVFAPTYWYIPDYTNTSTKKQFFSWSGFQPALGSSTDEMTQEAWGAFTSTGAISTIKFYSPSAVNFRAGSVITLYGINDS